MLSIVSLIIIIFLFLVISICYIMHFKNYTFEKSTKICVNGMKYILKEIFNLNQQIHENYPVFIGFNGYDIIPKNVENSFQDFSNYFDLIYYDSYNNNLPNRIIYCFKISNSKTDMDYINFTELLQEISAKVLINHFRNCEFYKPCDNFIVAKISADILYISIAKNDIGIEETKAIRRKIKNDYFHSQRKKNKKEISTDWDDSED